MRTAEDIALVSIVRDADDDTIEELARRLDLPFSRDLNEYTLDPIAMELVPEAIMRRRKILPMAFEGDALVVAVADPTNVVALDDIRIITERELKVVVARAYDIEQIIARLDGARRSTLRLLDQAADAARPATDDNVEAAISDTEAPIVKAIDRIIRSAIEQRASDIHIEPQEENVRIRYRIDGVLTEVMRTKKALSFGINSRLKVMSNLDIAERRLPQDGRMTLKLRDRKVDLRIATLPSSFGEKIVLRILDHTRQVLELAELGFDEQDLKRYRDSISRSYGAILLTGPTGSGKTSTMYASLLEMNSTDRNITTVENPIEGRLPGTTQIQVDPRTGLTFAVALRSILRSDPDVLMVGEMRDRETASIGIEAAQTGHLVLSTLHTNDAASALTRLVEMGIEPFLVAASLQCVVAQRLARRLCTRCRESYTPERDALALLGYTGRARRWFRPVGCRSCANTGYAGRIALLEVMPMSESLRSMTALHSTASEIADQAVAEGMRTLREDGVQKALKGVTSLEEVLRVTA